MADENIGQVSVQIIADYSQLSQGIQAAQNQASQGGARIAAAFQSAVAPTSALTQATDRLKAAEAAVASESAKALAAIQPTNVAYSTAQISLEHLNSELQAAQAAYSAEAAAAQASSSATAATATAANTAAAAQQTLAGATAAATAATQAQTAAAGQNIGAIMAGAAAATTAAAANNQIPPAQQAATASTFRLLAALALLRRGLHEMDEVRQSEMELLHLSEATGITAETFAKFQAAINRAGGDGDTFGKAIVFLTRSIEQGERGVKTMSDELSRLGATSKDPIQAFMQIADTIHNTKDKSEALAAASRVLGRGEQELIGIMGQGSAVLREYLSQSEGLARARAAGIESAQQLTAVEAEAKAQLQEMAVSVLPLLTTGLKIVETAFSGVNIVVKLVASTILATFAGATNAVKNFGIVLSDLAHGKWDMVRVDAGIALDGIRDDFKKFTKDVETRTGESVKFISDLWTKTAPKTGPGAGNAFPAPKGKDTSKQAAQEQMHAWQEELAERKAGLAASSDLDIFTIAEEKRFWESKLATLSEKSLNYRAVLQKVGQLNLEVMRQQRTAEAHEVAEQEKDFRERLKEAMQGAAMPETAGLHFAQNTLLKPQLNEGEYKAALEEIPKLTEKAAAEDHRVMREWIKASEAIFAEGGERTAAEASQHAAQMIAALEQLGGMEEEIAAQQKRKNAADRQVTKQTLRVAEVDASGEAANAEVDAQAQKIQLQSEYAKSSFNTTQQQIQYAQQLAAIEERILVIKREAALADFEAAVAAGDVVKAEQAAAQYLKEDNAIRLSRLRTETQIAEITRRSSFGGQLADGFAKDAQSAISRLSSGIAGLATQTKGWGQQFKGILKDIEKSLIETFAQSALKSGLNFLLSAPKQQGAGGGAAGGVAAAGTGALVTALATNTAATTAHSGIMASHLGIMASHLGAVIANTAAVVGHTAVVIAQTIATIAQTLATWALAAIEAIKGFFGFAKGGDPDPNKPFIAGEEGPELVHPKGRALTVVPAGKTRQMLGAAQQGLGFRVPHGALDVPSAPASAFFSANQAQAISSSSSSSMVTNQNTGSIGQMHFNITSPHSPREVARQIANEIKRATPKFSPVSS
jgi:hypothetical protein